MVERETWWRKRHGGEKDVVEREKWWRERRGGERDMTRLEIIGVLCDYTLPLVNE